MKYWGPSAFVPRPRNPPGPQRCVATIGDEVFSFLVAGPSPPDDDLCLTSSLLSALDANKENDVPSGTLCPLASTPRL